MTRSTVRASHRHRGHEAVRATTPLADEGNRRVHRVSPDDGTVTTALGNLIESHRDRRRAPTAACAVPDQRTASDETPVVRMGQASG